MRRHSSFIGVFAIACGLLANAASAWAASPQTWVSGTGSDAGACPVTAPCKTFSYAFSQTNSSGAINVLSSGNFGPLTINRSISIVADGAEAVINTAAGGAAIIVQGSGILVSLRGLTIDLRGTANIGINFVSGAALHVQNSVIRRATDGIAFAPASGTRELYVADSVIADSLENGIWVNPTGSGGVKAILDRVRVENSGNLGIAIFGNNTTGSVTATVRDSVSAGNNFGIVAQEGGSGTTEVMVDRSAAVNNGTGIFATVAGATIRIGDSTVSGNGTGLATAPAVCPCAVIASYGTNKVNGNTDDGVTPTSVTMK
jgi:hypothetical protein